jgi:eukaryotic-like serine/threonine-protein kinase
MSTVDQTSISAPRPPDFVSGYRLERVVGRGGMGEVYEAVQLSLGRKVAVKLLNPELAKDEQFVGRFEKEGAALAALHHPSIVSIVDKGRTESTYYLVMEFVQGRSMRERMRDPDLDDLTRLRMIGQVTKALEYAHQRGVVHRDIKPENILFDEQAGDIAKVTDFGLAGLDPAVWKDQNLTGTHVAMGTMHYMAPEQKVDARKADHRADLYAMGVVLYELFVGEVPQGNFLPLSQRKPGADRRLDAIVSRCLKPSPEDRYQSATELLHDLEPLLPAMSMISSPKMKPLDRALMSLRKAVRKAGFYAGSALVVWALAIVGAAFLRQRSIDARESAGAQLITDSGNRFPFSARGRLDRDAHTLSVGDGPDMLSLVSLGRKAKLDGNAVIYDPPDDLRSGRTEVDATLEGDGLSLAATVTAEETRPSRLEPMWAVFRGPRAESRAALMLVGPQGQGRYVAFIISGSGNAPLLEWNLGSGRQGSMTAPVAQSPGPQRLELRIDPDTFELEALVGKGRDQRRVAEKLSLGKGWKEVFGRQPHLGFGCLEGTCQFRDVSWEGLDPRPPTPPPLPAPPPPTPQPEVARAPEARPQPKKPPPPPPKKPAPKKR